MCTLADSKLCVCARACVCVCVEVRLSVALSVVVVNNFFISLFLYLNERGGTEKCETESTSALWGERRE